MPVAHHTHSGGDSGPVLEEMARDVGIAAGKVYYVWNSGSDDESGIDPDNPLATIQAAIDLCRANYNDYVYVMDHWAEASLPIEVNKEHIHIIACGVQGLRTCLTAGSQDKSIFDISGVALYAEIAGFNLGGGNSKPCIGLNNSAGVWIHHNRFGHPYVQDTPLYGIGDIGAGNNTESLIEDNIFYGDGVGGGTITSNGICLEKGATAAKWDRTIIRRNLFLGLVGATRAGAILLDGAKGVNILGNTFHITDAGDGDAINLIDVCRYCLIDENKALRGMVAVNNTYNPFRDLNVNTYNAWGNNTLNGVRREPIGT